MNVRSVATSLLLSELKLYCWASSIVEEHQINSVSSPSSTLLYPPNHIEKARSCFTCNKAGMFILLYSVLCACLARQHCRSFIPNITKEEAPEIYTFRRFSRMPLPLPILKHACLGIVATQRERVQTIHCELTITNISSHRGMYGFCGTADFPNSSIVSSSDAACWYP